MLATGLGLLFGAVNVYFRDSENIVDMIVMVVTWASPVLYVWTMVADKLGEFWFTVYQLNPMTVAVEVFHWAFWLPTDGRQRSVMPAGPADASGCPWRCSSLLAVLFLGQLTFRRLEGRFAQEL